jgi:hypothetical protein
MVRKIPVILTVVYLILVLLSIIPIFTGDDPLSSIFAVFLTVPWSFLFGRLLPGSAFDNLAVGLVLLVIGAAINAAIIYYICRWLVSRLAR